MIGNYIVDGNGNINNNNGHANGEILREQDYSVSFCGEDTPLLVVIAITESY